MDPPLNGAEELLTNDIKKDEVINVSFYLSLYY